MAQVRGKEGRDLPSFPVLAFGMSSLFRSLTPHSIVDLMLETDRRISTTLGPSLAVEIDPQVESSPAMGVWEAGERMGDGPEEEGRGRDPSGPPVGW